MSDMLKIKSNWKYYLNIASQAFPLKTNAELVKILKTYNGSNDIGTSLLGARIPFRCVFLQGLISATAVKLSNTRGVRPY